MAPKTINALVIVLILIIVFYLHPLFIYDYKTQVSFKQNYRKTPFIIKHFYDEKVLNQFTPNNLIKYLDDKIIVSRYMKNGFYSQDDFDIETSKFLNKDFPMDDGMKYQTKKKIKKGDKLDDLLKININKYFNLFTTNKLTPKLIFKKLRISLSPWDFPEHWDGCDQIVVVLYGNRTFYMGDKIFNLKPGDALYLPMTKNHYIKSTGTDFSMLIGFGIQASRKEAIENAKEFKKLWPRQYELNKAGKF